MTKAYRLLLLLLSLWLAGWIYVSWAAIQDDALIHLRYADNLFLHHFITYDGVHPDYGASSLLYVGLLASQRNLTTSADLARATSSFVHCLLFAGLASVFYVRLSNSARVVKLAGALLLILVVMPSAVRWLDDGMETGLAVSSASLLAWLVHEEFVGIGTGEDASSVGRYVWLMLLAFLAVMLRTELALLCGMSFAILIFAGRPDRRTEVPLWRTLLRHSHLLAGTGLALGVIVATMHVLLPDTAVAKSHGAAHWFNTIHDTATTLAGAFSFGAGMFLFWLLTLLLLALSHVDVWKRSTLLANASFPVLLALASFRGQEIQGVRYFAWTLFFPVIWNILELAQIQSATRPTGKTSAVIVGAFLVLLAIESPFEVRAMFHVMTRRSETMRRFESQHLDMLAERHGVASDIGYIGYFTGAKICDLAGLVNGRAAARLTSVERNQACMRTNPDFVFGNVGQLSSLTGLADFSGWIVCGRYDFTNVRSLDTHFLVVRPELADQVCQATGAAPEPFTNLFAAAP